MHSRLKEWVALWVWVMGLLMGLCMTTLPAMAVEPVRLLWITGEITPAARTGLVEREAKAQGLLWSHMDFALSQGARLDAAEQARLQQALAQADAVWVDAPHASVEARLRALLREPLASLQAHQGPRAGVVWSLSEGSVQVWPKDTAGRVAAYLQAGGASNVKQAVALMAAQARGQRLGEWPAPVQWPARGVYHPDAPHIMADASEWLAWQSRQPGTQGRPVVALLVHRHHVVNGQSQWLDQWLRQFEQRGMSAFVVFGQQVDPSGLEALLGRQGDPDHSVAHVLVSHQLLAQGARLQGLLQRWQLPLLLTQPYRSGDEMAWQNDVMGLSSSDVPFYLAQPEGAGGIDPLVVVAHEDQGRHTVLIQRQALAVVDKAARLVALQRTPNPDKRLVAMVYNYPPGGSNFGASFLNVPRSLEQVSGQLAQAGYATEAVPEAQWIAGLKPLLAAYYPQADLRALLQSDQADALPLSQYLVWWHAQSPVWRERVLAQWGPPERSRYVVEWQGRQVFVIPRMKVGHLQVLPQPPREETLRLGQNPFMHRSKMPLSHHYSAVYLWARQANALIHFGTHGTQEWAPGKARGLDVLDDALLPLGDVPVIYPYIVDNLGEALTAKRRGRALMVSHRTPAFAPAGFEARMARMHELMHEWETVDVGPTKVALERQLLGQFVEHQLHRDLGWKAEDIAANFERFLEQLHPYLDSLAQSSQPQGLAVFGLVPEEARRQQIILQALRKPLIDALGEDIDEAFLIDHATVAASRPACWLKVALLDAEAASRLDLRPPLPDGPVPNRAARKPIDQPALRALAERAQTLESLLNQEGEMPGLLKALQGGFLEAAYGGDPIRNPESLPTGRNLTGLDPSRLPTRQAYEVARGLFHDWLEQYMATHGGKAPERLALSLWAGETLRHQGIMEAQALVALGVQPVWDDAGRPTRLTLIPAQALGRPRVDVLLSITGSYRDQFPALMALVDQGVALAAGAEPDNAVLRNTRQVQGDLHRAGLPAEQAKALAQARVFGNATGDYGTGLADAVQSDQLQRDDARLGEMFLQRMSQPYVQGVPLNDVPAAAAAQALGAHLRQTQAALLSRTSHLYALASSDDPFQYLGGLAAAARAAGKTEALGLYVSQLQDSSEARTETAQRVMALEMQSRYLHPGWLQAQKQEGYAGTLQVLKAVQFTWGWQAVAPDMVRDDHWQSYFDVLVRDRHKLGLPQWLKSNPQAYAQSLERMIEAQRLGHWQPDEATRRELAQTYQALTEQEALPGEQASVRRWVRAELGMAPANDTAAQAAPPLGMVVALAGQRVPLAPPRFQAPAPQAVVKSPSPPQGMVLERQPAPQAAAPVGTLSTLLTWSLLGLWACMGALWQARQSFDLKLDSHGHRKTTR